MSVKRGLYKKVLLYSVVFIIFFLSLFFFSQKYPLIQHIQLFSSSPTGEQFYSVQKVIDGDTIDVLVDGKTERVRFIGIDAPEFGYDGNPDMCFAHESYQRVKKLVEGKIVKLESDATQDDRDKYNRLLRYVFLNDGTLVNEILVYEGFAREYTYLGNFYLYQRDFLRAEQQARTAKQGLWADNVCL